MRFVALIVSVLLTTVVQAAQTSAQWRVYTNSCGYFSSVNADMQLFYTDPWLPDDAEVKLIYGLGNPYERRDWEQRQVATTMYGQNTKTRKAEVTVALAQRSSPAHYTKFQFVWEVRLSNGHVYHDQGGHSTWGFYQADLRPTDVTTCQSPGEPLPQFQHVEVYSVNRE